jgi:hypothetical protein
MLHEGIRFNSVLFVFAHILKQTFILFYNHDEIVSYVYMMLFTLICHVYCRPANAAAALQTRECVGAFLSAGVGRTMFVLADMLQAKMYTAQQSCGDCFLHVYGAF